MTAPSSHSVLILGAGVAGLAAAYHLSQQNYRVTVLDHPDWQDGFRISPANAVPTVLGCHYETRQLLKTLDRKETAQQDRVIPLEFWLPDGRTVAYQSARLPGAFQWMMSLFSFDGLAWQDRWKLFSHVEQIWEQAQTLPPDLENRIADEWLASIGQSAESRERIWHPLVQWLTGNALTRLSAATFVRLLSTVFLGDASDARLTSIHGSIEQRLLAPIRERLPQDEVRILPLTQQPSLRFGKAGISDVRLDDGTVLHAQWYMMALPYPRLLALLPERLLTRYAYFAQLTELNSLSDIIVHLTWHQPTPIQRLLLLPNHSFQQLTMTPTGSAAVDVRLSSIGESALAELDNDQLAERSCREFLSLWPRATLKHLTVQHISRDPHAALVLAPGAARLRPLSQSPIPNFLVAGAWTDTGWPANLESALTSARRCTQLITGHAA